MWSKEYFYLSVTACFNKLPSKKGKLKLPLIFSGEHCTVKPALERQCNANFPQSLPLWFFLLAVQGSFCLASCIPIPLELPALPHSLWGSWQTAMGLLPVGRKATEGLFGDGFSIFWWEFIHLSYLPFSYMAVLNSLEIFSLGKILQARESLPFIT